MPREQLTYTQNAFELVASHLPPKLLIPLTGLAVTMNSVDLWIHADMGQSIRPRRLFAENVLGTEITSHLGNSIFPFALMSVVVLVAELIKQEGFRRENQTLLTIAHHLPLFGLAGIAVLNAVIENTLQSNPEGVGDFMFGIFSAINAALIFTSILNQKQPARRLLK